jgi:hypothetical protein
MSNPDPSGGIALIIFGTIIACVLDTLATGRYLHWLWAIAAIIVGLQTVRMINN